MSSCTPEENFGSDPAFVRWQVVRGDTASIRVEFLQDDESTAFDISGWSFDSTAYDQLADVLDVLTVEVNVSSGYVDIIAPSEITSNWGTGFRSLVAEIPFDLQVTLEDDTIWTPVLGTITVLGDVTTGTL